MTQMNYVRELVLILTEFRIEAVRSIKGNAQTREDVVTKLF